ncbi:MAG: 3-deoxy-D-manno-octulosonic acid transferase [Ignavibacteria bacterium]
MKKIWFIVYNFLFLPFFWIIINISSFFNDKIRKGLTERKDVFKLLKTNLKELEPDKKNILIQCSSLGEFEQAKPIIEELDKTNSFNFIVSFFSPSGFNHSKVDIGTKSKIIKTYLPFDWFRCMKNFVKLINPKVFLFIKYDLWFNLLFCSEESNIYKVLVNATYNKKDIKWRFFLTRSFYKTVYNFFNVILTSNEKDAYLLRDILSRQIKVLYFGDTKIERINKATELAKNENLLNDKILTNKKVFVVGSSWVEDENIVLPAIDSLGTHKYLDHNSLLTIIAPHEPTEDNLRNLEEKINSLYSNLTSIRYSELISYNNQNVILIDCVGLLISLYKYADVSYVGGGFRTGLHNVMEPAGYGVPVLFGNEKISEDGEILIKSGDGIAVSGQKTLFNNLCDLLNKEHPGNELGLKSNSLFGKKTEASKKIAELFYNFR